MQSVGGITARERYFEAVPAIFAMDKAGLKLKTADELEAEDLFCPVKRVWGVVEKV